MLIKERKLIQLPASDPRKCSLGNCSMRAPYARLEISLSAQRLMPLCIRHTKLFADRWKLRLPLGHPTYRRVLESA